MQHSKQLILTHSRFCILQAQAVFFIVLLSLICVGCTDSELPTLDATSKDAMDQSIDAIKATLPNDRRTEFEDALTTISQAEAAKSDAPFGLLIDLDGLDRRTRDRINGLTADEIFAEAKEAKKVIELQSLKAKASSVTSQLQTLRSQTEFYYYEHDDQYPDLVSSWEPYVEETLHNGRTYGPYLRKPSQNPFMPDKANNTRVIAWKDTPTNEAAWQYNRETGEVRAIVPHDIAVLTGLVPESHTVGGQHPDIMTVNTN